MTRSILRSYGFQPGKGAEIAASASTLDVLLLWTGLPPRVRMVTAQVSWMRRVCRMCSRTTRICRVSEVRRVVRMTWMATMPRLSGVTSVTAVSRRIRERVW